MSNADQLKYMRMPRNQEPKAIVYPLPAKLSVLTREDVQRIVFEKVSDILYHVLRSEEEINIVTMSAKDFDEFIERVMCSDEE